MVLKTSHSLCFIFVLWIGTFTSAVLAQLPDLSSVEQRLENLSPEDPLYPVLNDTQNLLVEVQDNNEAAEQNQLEVENLPRAVAQAKAELENSTPPDPELPADLTLEKAESRLATIRAELQQARLALEEATQRETQRAARLVAIPTELTQLREKLSEFDSLTAPAPTATPLETAGHQRELAREKALQSELARLVSEQSRLEVSGDLINTQKLIAVRRVSQIESLLQFWSGQVSDLKRREVQRREQEAERTALAFDGIKPLANIARSNAEKASLRLKLSELISEIKVFEGSVRETRRLITEQRENAQKRIALLESADLSIDTKTGDLLRRQRSRLPTTKDLREQLRTNVRASTEAQINRLQLSETLETNAITRSERITELQAAVNSGTTEEQIVNLLDQERTILSNLLVDYDSYISALRTANEVTQEAIDEVRNYSLFLDERLLWIASAPRLSPHDIAAEASAFRLLITEPGFGRWWRGLIYDLRRVPFLWGLFLITFVGLLLRRKRDRELLKDTAVIARRKICLSIAPTFKAIGSSILLALPSALVCFYLSWRVPSPSALSSAFLQCGFFFAVIGFARALVRPNGVLAAHLNFGDERAAFTARHLRWIYFAVPSFLFLTTALELPSSPLEAGRLSLIAVLVIAGLAAFFLLHPRRGLFAKKSPPSALTRPLFILGISIPIIFIVAASLGYVSSVKTIRIQTLQSLWLILSVIFLSSILIRWILISRRKLARDLATKKYQAAAAARKREKEGEPTVDLPSQEELQAEAVNVVAVEDQTNKLVRVALSALLIFGLWTIWSTSFPALSVLDQVELYTTAENTTETVEQSSPADSLPDLTQTDQATASDNSEKNVVSLQDVLGGILIVALTFIAAANLPGLLELTILQRLNFKAGSNYAVTSVVRYVIVVVGILFAFGRIGVSWQSVQWLAAAVTLGIGFGLQEIFANFVAGLILLIERPIRLGDIVTVGNDVSGKVTKIKIRATTILQFNNRELVVPNKEFITGQLVNWTLSDNILRFKFLVGVAYGTDTKKVERILHEILNAHEFVLKEPGPEVLFLQFGASTLDFQIRAYVGRFDKFLVTQGELHHEIAERFEQEGIEIAFPQQDVHIRSLPEPAKTGE